MDTSSTNIILYGIKNCDTVKKAKNWLTSQGIGFEFHDVRNDGLSAATINSWLASESKHLVLNKKSTSWRKLSAEQQQQAETAQLTELLLDNPTLIKRPVLTMGRETLVGFSPEKYSALFAE